MAKNRRLSLKERVSQIVHLLKNENELTEVQICLKLDIHPESFRRYKPFITALYPNTRESINEEGVTVWINE